MNYGSFYVIVGGHEGAFPFLHDSLENAEKAFETFLNDTQSLIQKKLIEKYPNKNMLFCINLAAEMIKEHKREYKIVAVDLIDAKFLRNGMKGEGK